MTQAEEIAKEFHTSYEKLASNHGYSTRKSNAVPWDKVLPSNKSLIIATVQDLLDRGVILPHLKEDGTPTLGIPKELG
jgi:hypothetical protein